MRTAAGFAGLLLVAAVLFEAFETIVLPQRVARRWRITQAVYALTWPPYRAAAAAVHNGQRRERILSYYGPGSLLFTIISWFGAFVFGYTLALWAFAHDLGGHVHSFGDAAYVASSMLFTLGLTDLVPHGSAARALAIAAGGTGFASLALLVAYLPTLYQAFSRRETYIAQLDARAGSPPTAGELLARNTGEGNDDLGPFLLAWESWGSDLLESLLSFPTLGFYRSHHENQSWLAALTAVLDTCSLVLVSEQHRPHRQAKLTYAMCRHAAVDLTRSLHASPATGVDRLDAVAFERLRARLASSEWHVPDDAAPKLAKLRSGYESYVVGLSRHLLMPLPDWTPPEGAQDSWQLTQVAEPPRRFTRRAR
ncbi:MAG: two pore domain potassium channel family protein [Actinomycetia bacterium]|nr:two pore domain potassium channel family protein [Actinomycetes bacterium]